MPFEFTSPDTIEQALQLHGDGAQWFAGGTDLVPEFKEGLTNPTRLVNLKRLRELRGVESREDGLYVGALVTLTDLVENPRMQTEYTALAQACELSASPQIRNVGTIGGNLCQNSRCPYYRGDFRCFLKGGERCFMRDGENSHAAIIGYHDCVHVHPSDPANALVAFDADILARGPAGERAIRAGEFFHAPQGDDRRMNILAADEFISAIRLPPLGAPTRSVYLKAMDRAQWTFAIVSAAVRLDFEGDQVRDARVVLGGVAPVPWRDTRVENRLRGARLDGALAAEAAAQVLAEAKPLAQNAYKVRLARALVKRALLQFAV